MNNTNISAEMRPDVVLPDGYVRKNHLPVCESPLLSVENLSFSYAGDKKVLDRVSFNICDLPQHGQVVTILGPSGVGKTTLLDIITGAIRNTIFRPNRYEGRVQVYDDVLGTPVDIKPGMVGKVTQNYFFEPYYTVGKNLENAVRKRKELSKQEQDAKVDEMLENFDMTEFRDRYRTELSGGQKQRVAIMQQLLCSDHYVVLDEPFTGLDPIMKDHVAALLNKVADFDEHNTLIVVTHDVTQALACSDTLLLLGRDFDASGNPKPGARIQKIYDLVSYGLAYQPDVMQLPQFGELMKELRADFKRL
jgi:ABC-type nitrate/sulfonate/bicarbonate transport system ATPase subunit